MKKLQRLATAAAGVGMAAALTLPAANAANAAPAAPAERVGTQVSAKAEGGSRVDLISGALTVANQILDLVVQQVESSDNREGAVNALLQAAWYKNDQAKNILVMKADHPYTADLQGISFDAVYHPAGQPSFRVVAFDSGTVTNNGDGGYINWAFQGVFDRQDMTVTFQDF